MTRNKSGQFIKGGRPSIDTEFKKGGIPWNKGIVYEQILGSKHPNWKGGKPDCVDCGIKLKKYVSVRCSPCHLKSDKAKAHIARVVPKKGTFSKEKHWNWKGGISSPDKLERVRFRRELQKRIFARDNYSCQICGQYSGNLQVDHIKKWKDYPDLRFDPDNCRTLCMACHYYVTFKRKLPDGVIWGHRLNQRVAS